MLAGVLASLAGVRHISVREGLSSRQVYEVKEDKDGFIWIYTNAGLDRFDGSTFKHYSLDDSKLSNDHVLFATSMHCDNDGRLWVALKSGDIYRYDRLSDSFEKEYSFTDSEVLIYNFALSSDNTLTVCTNKGVYNCKAGAEPRKVALGGKLTRCIVADEEGGFYVGTDNGVYQLSPSEGFKSSFVDGTAGLYTLSLAIQSGKLFVGTFSNGTLSIDISNGRIAPLPFRIPSIPVNAMAAYGDHSLLIGVDGAGVYLIDARSGQLERHYHDSDETDTDLSGNTVTDVFVDSRSGLWIATSHCGLNYIPPYTHSMTVLRTKRGNPDSLISDYVNVIFEDSDGDLWFGTDMGVSRLVSSTGQWKRYLQRNGYASGVILSVGEDTSGRIWIGSYGDGVSVIDKRTDRVEHIPVRSPGGSEGTGTEYVFTSYGDPTGNVWIGGINGDLTRYDTHTGRYYYYDEDCLAHIVADAGGTLLFGGNRGVGRYDRATDKFSWTTRFDTVSIHYPVRCLLADTVADVLWIGTTGDGLIRYDRKAGKARRYTTADGMSANTVYSIVRDRAGCCWVCTETDLYRIDPQSGKLTKFTYNLGTSLNAFNPPAGIMSRDGSVMLGTAEGCVIFNPEEKFGEPVSDRILFTYFRLHDRTVQPGAEGSPLNKNINLTDRVELTSTQNNIEIGFTTINFASPQRVGFEYTLEGHDEEWSNAGTAHSAKYSDLSPGTYSFRLRAIDRYNDKILSERSLTIVIHQPLWLTWWAKLIYGLLLAGMAVLATAYISRHNREKHIKAQIQTFTSLAHDIRTPMSLIKAPLLNIEMEKELSENTRENLARARAGIDKTMGMLTEMLELRQDPRLRKRLTVEPCDIREYLQVKAEEYSMLAKFKDIALECDVPDDMPPVMIDPDIFGHIVDNLMSNALKYTHQGTIRLSAALTRRKRWRLAVSDTGIGISKSDAKHIFKHRHRAPDAIEAERSGMGMGLLITRHLVRSHKGHITFVSKPGEGTTFTVTLPLCFPNRYHRTALHQDIQSDQTPAAAEEMAESPTRSRIFIIEDDPDMLTYMKESLENEYDVTASSDALHTLEKIRHEIPDLIITDVVMPKLRGDELCRIVKTDIATSHIPVILLSGLASREDIVAGFEAHADDYIVKPFDIIVLKARIRNIIKSRSALNQRLLSEDCEPAEEDFTNELDRQFMTKVKESIDSHLSDSEFSIYDLCTELGMSRTSVYNKIKSLTGQSLNEFIRIIRLNRSKELLATRRYNISEVAYMVGFSDPKYFSTCFKKQFGISPSKL